LKWVSEEKQKTLAWCEEQKQIASKERRAAAKLVYLFFIFLLFLFVIF
jgi:hypothetical protein